MKNCIICGKELKGNQKYRCLKCYCNTDNDKAVDEYIKNNPYIN